MDTDSNKQRIIDRLDQFTSYKNINDNQLTRSCGLAIGTIGKSRKPGKDLSRRSAEMVLNHYPEIDRAWFLYGRGEMLGGEKSMSYPMYPLVDTAKAECGRPAGLSEAITKENLPLISIPGIPSDTEFFIVAAGYSMVNNARPELSIPPGALVGLSPNGGDFIRWGEVYALATVDGIMIKKVLPDENNSDNVRCVSYNKEEYPEFSLPKAEIYDLARLTCVVPVFVR